MELLAAIFWPIFALAVTALVSWHVGRVLDVLGTRTVPQEIQAELEQISRRFTDLDDSVEHRFKRLQARDRRSNRELGDELQGELYETAAAPVEHAASWGGPNGRPRLRRMR